MNEKESILNKIHNLSMCIILNISFYIGNIYQETALSSFPGSMARF